MTSSAQSVTSGRRGELAPCWATLSGRSHGARDAHGCPLVLLHGLTFDHHMWDPMLTLLPGSHRAIALDLPGHGDSPSLRRGGLRPVVAAIHDAVLDAGLTAPIVVGHSIGGALATVYASQHPAAGVVSIDAPIRLESFAALVRSLGPQLTGEAFASAWSVFQASWHPELLPPAARALLASGDRPGDDRMRRLVLSYQADLLAGTLDDVLRWRDDGLARLSAAAIPYVTLHASTIDRADRAWLIERVPQAEILEWRVGHHFPHLSNPGRFAALLTGLAAGCYAEARR
jgi:pimeloyl-ACP methyl ester carboxylesterase